MPELTFHDLCRSIALDFLQTAVVFDDRAYFSTEDTTKPKRNLKKPGRSSAPLFEPDNETDKRKAHDLDAGELMAAFAMKGITCAVLKPEEPGSLESQVTELAKRSDILVLDWQIGGDNGKTTVELIAKILKDDAAQGIERLRLFVIYTGEKGIAGIITKARKNINAHVSGFRKDGEFLRRGNALVAFHIKESARVPASMTASKVAIAQLPDVVINDFTKLTQGILPSVALESLSALRKNTHKILSKLNVDLDAPYVTHRTLLVTPDEAQDHLIPLVSSEIQSVIEGYEPQFKADLSTLTLWLDSQVADGLVLEDWLNTSLTPNPRPPYTSVTARGLVIDMIENGYDHRPKGIDLEKPSKVNVYTNLLSKKSDGPKRDKELALRMSVRTRYDRPDPQLTLGTVVKSGQTYLVCVQPECDSVRLTKKTCFPFLKLTEKTQDHFSFVIEDTDVIELNLTSKPSNLELRMFETNGSKVVRAERSGISRKKWIFRDAENRPLQYVCNLKPDHAQRIAYEFGQQIARIGLTESEWLRRWAKRKNV